MKISFLILFSLIGFQIMAQTVISGVVTDSLLIPVPYAHIFLSKTTVSVLANESGEYSMEIPQDGNYEMIVASLGYQSFSKEIKAEVESQQINVQLNRRIFVLDEVVVNGKDKNRRRNYKTFFECFIGKSENSRFCTIENPKDLIVYRQSDDSILTAFSTKPLIITNTGLGYRIFYDLKEFSYNFKSGHLSFSGNHYFQELEGNGSKMKRWKYSRIKAYSGSRMHLLRAIYKDSLAENSFELNRYKVDSVFQRWDLAEAVETEDIYKGYSEGTVLLYFPETIIISYNNDQPKDITAITFNDHPVLFSSITFNDSLQVYKNGYYPSPHGVTWGGSMGSGRIAEMLPYDYIPVSEKKGKDLRK